MISDQLTLDNFIEKEYSFLELTSKVLVDDVVKRASNIFDFEFVGESKTIIKIPKLPKKYKIGLIVGSSGSGKTNILKTIGTFSKHEWSHNKAILSHFESFEDATNKFGAVGLNSVPSWFRPYSVLSNGEKFRVDLARTLESNCIVDEFTSVVNRDVAISASVSIGKYIRNNNIENVTFASCHYDIIDYLNPDWVYDTDAQCFLERGSVRQPNIKLEIMACSRHAWIMFKQHHYLSEDIHKGSTCYLACMNGRPVAFIALLALPGRDVKNAWREHRVVVLPDFQGMGIGNKFSEHLAQKYIETGRRYFSKTSNPRFGEHRNKSKLWRGTINNMKDRKSYLKSDGSTRGTIGYGMSERMIKIHSERVCYSHEYMGVIK